MAVWKATLVSERLNTDRSQLNSKESPHLFTLIFYTLLIMYRYAMQCLFATN